jgi:AI-2 transport protein TqsA
MSEHIDDAAPGNPFIEATRRLWPESERTWAVFRWLVVLATAWFLLKELAPLLRPLLLAVFLAYVILPVRVYVRGQVRGGAGHLALVAFLGIVVVGLAVLAYLDIVRLGYELPRLHERAKEILAQVTDYGRQHIPGLGAALEGSTRAEELSNARIKELLESLANLTAGVLVEALEVIFYLVLILFEAGRLPQRMRRAFADEQAERLLATVGSINAAMASYLKVKVKINFILAVPVTLILWICGVKFAILWGALTFFANFVPYLGSLVACTIPILFGFFDLDFGWQPFAVAILLPVVHVSSAYLIEPAMTGKAVDVSPLVVLIALSFWGLCWGLTGMILAVPLTAMLKIILGSAPGTRPIADLMGGEEGKDG